MRQALVTEISCPRPDAPASSVIQSVARTAPSLDALTGLRFLAAMGVVVWHFGLPVLKGGNYVLFNIANDGFIAVDLFYILSGFILCYSYLGKDGALRGNPRNFYAARFARIYPAYFLAFILAAPWDITTSLHANSLMTAIFKLSVNAGLVLTLLQAWTPWTAWSWNYPAWSVSVEAFFYLLFPWIGVRLARLGPASARKLTVFLWLAGLAAPFALWTTTGATGNPTLGHHLQMAIEFTPILRLPEFMIGILVGRAYLRGEFGRLSGVWLSSIATISIFTVLGFCPSLPHPLLANGLIAPLFAMLIVGLALGGGPIAWFLSLPPMVLLGEASYGIYILQVPLALFIRRPPPYYSGKMLVLYCAGLTLCSVLSWRFFETPLRKKIRRRLSC